jgi:hypothetical protein
MDICFIYAYSNLEWRSGVFLHLWGAIGIRKRKRLLARRYITQKAFWKHSFKIVHIVIIIDTDPSAIRFTCTTIDVYSSILLPLPPPVSLAPSARFSIPQKLSHSVKSVPRSQRMVTWFWVQMILTASAVGSSSSSEEEEELSLASSSSSSSDAVLWFFAFFDGGGCSLLSFSCCCCWNFLFRLADRDHTFSRAKATPVCKSARQCHLRSRSVRIALTFSSSSSLLASLTGTVHSVAVGSTACTNSPCLATAFAGLKSPKLHATAQRLVLCPAFKFVAAKLVTPCSRSLATSCCRLASRPSIDEYHCTRSRRTRLSSRILETNPTSPPSQIISFVDPVHTAEGGISLLP